MDRRIISLAIFSATALVVNARAELQLTPQVVEGIGDGVKFTHLAFSDGDKTINYLPPRGWQYSGSATQLTLRPLGKAQAEAIVSRSPLTSPGAFDEESLKKIVDNEIAALSKGNQTVAVVSQEKNPLMINRKETFLLVLSYESYGQRFNRSILFLNRDREQIRFQLTCREADFKDLQKAFFASQFSWENL